jgi:predicted HNH restriction endonuclease
VCSVCGNRIGHGGQGMCRSHYLQYLKKSRYEELIKLLGGVCDNCKKGFPVSVFDFHHINPKEKKFAISNEITNKSMKELIVEAKKCILLCANCHRILHFCNGEKP